MNKTGFFAIVSIALFLCSSCGKLGYDKPNTHGINVKVSGVDTKASVVTTSTLVSGLKEFNMSAYVTENWNRDVIAPSGVISAGLYVNPWIHGNAEPFKDVRVYSDGTQKWTITGNECGHKDSEGNDYPTFCWVNGVPMRFFAYAPVSIKGSRSISKADSSVDETYPFSYATKQASAGLVSSADCDDIIFAGATNTAQYGEEQGTAEYAKLINDTKDYIDLKFYHALSQVRFCLSTDDGTFPTTLKLVSVKLKNFVANGSCIFSQPSTFAWTLGTGATDKADFIQNFTDAQFGRKDAGTNKEIIPENWVKSSYTKDSQEYNLYTCTGDVFFFLPQNPAGKELELTLQVGEGTPFKVSAKLLAVSADDSSKIWEPGKYYTYKIKAFKTVTVELIANDWIDGSSDITI